MVKTLIESGIDTQLVSDDGEMAIAYILRKSTGWETHSDRERNQANFAHRHTIFWALIDSGTDINDATLDGFSVLHLSAMQSEQLLVLNFLDNLIRRGADVNAPDSTGKNPLHHVEGEAAAGLLIQAGADVNAADQAGYTPIFYQENPAVIKILIDAGANINHIGKLEAYTPRDYLEEKLAKVKEKSSSGWINTKKLNALEESISTLSSYGVKSNL